MSESPLLDAFVAAYPGFVSERVAAFGIDPVRIRLAIEEGRKWLRSELEALLSLEPEAQRQSPLEVFRMALAFPTEALRDLGAPVASRDDADTDALPGDLYGLAPASSQELGTEAFEAHIAWGIAKAGAIAGVVPAASHHEPVTLTVALLSTNLMDRTAIGEVVNGAGYELAAWRNPAAVSAGLAGSLPAMVLVDLQHPAADDTLRTLAERGVPAIAFGPHVDDIALARAKALGASDALPRSRFFRRLPQLLPEAV